MTGPTPGSKVGPWTTIVLVAMAVVVSLFVICGADLYWAATAGRRAMGGAPPGPLGVLAVDPRPDPMVLGEIILAAAAASGPAGVGLLQVVLVGATMGVLAASAARRGVGDAALAGVLAVAVGGVMADVVVARMPVLSLLPWAVLLATLRRNSREGSPPPWWVVGLLGLWGNLHGGVLVGLGLLGSYLLGTWGRPQQRVRTSLVVLASWIAVFVVTPAGIDTWRYYAAALTNEAAARGEQLWAPISLGEVRGAGLVVVAAALALLAGRPTWRRSAAAPSAWEWLAIAGLASATLMSARHGIWLVTFLVGPAAVGLTRSATRAANRAEDRRPDVVAGWWANQTGLVRGGLTVVVIGALCLPLLAQRSVAISPAVARTKTWAPVVGEAPVLTTSVEAEALTWLGTRITIGNPLEAYPQAAQAAYLDFVAGRRWDDSLAPPGSLVVTRAGSASDALLAREGVGTGVATVDGQVFRRVGGDP